MAAVPREGVLAIEHLEFSFRGISGAFHLGPVNLTIPYGSLTFWIGANGSGKSTLARLIAGELLPDRGTISATSGRALYHHQSLNENIFPTLRVADHLRLAGEREGRKAEIAASFPELMAVLSSYPDELSGGQLQLLAFSSLALRSCRLYILDEVLNHLDRPIAARVLAWIRSRLLQSDNAVVVISHDLIAAATEADFVVVFADGRIAHTLSRAEIAGDPARLLRLLSPGGTSIHEQV